MKDKFFEIFKHLPNPIFLLDQSGYVEEMNQAAAKLLRSGGEVKMKNSRIDLSQRFGELKAFLSGTNRELIFEISIRAGRGMRVYAVHSRRLGAPAGSHGAIVSMNDITHLRKKEAERGIVEEELHAISQTAIDAIISIDAGGRILFWNHAAEIIFGYTREEMLHHSLRRIMPAQFWKRHRNGLRRFLQTSKAKIIGTTVELTAVRKDGSEFPIELSLSHWQTDQGPLFTAILRDITERRRLQDEIRQLSLTDQLTGVCNRRGFYLLAENQLQLARRRQRGFLLFYADLDGMKTINDRWGHQAGDQALIDTADVLKSTFRNSDIIARIGGDEFIVLAIDSSEKDGDYFAARLARKIHSLNLEKTRNFTLSLSTGSVYWDPKDALSLDDLISKADRRMYASKARKSVRRQPK